MKVLVLGIGNTLLSDEGVGVHVVNRLLSGYTLPPEVRAVDGGTSGMTLLDDVAACDYLIIVDCGRLDAAPGTVMELFDEAVPAFFQQRISPHQIGLSDLLAGAALIDALPAGLSLIAVEPDSIALGTALTGAGELGCRIALDCVLARLEALGLPPVFRLSEVA